MNDYSGWSQNLHYNAINDRITSISALWDAMGDVTADGVQGAPGVVVTKDNVGMSVVQRGAGANMSVDVNPGHCVISVPGDQRGSYVGVLDATKNIPISGSDLTFGRIDSIYAVVTDSNYGDTTNIFETKVITGTPSATPARPPAPSNYAVWLADVTVDAGVTSIVNAKITDKRTYAAPMIATGRRPTGGRPLHYLNGGHWYNPAADSLEWTVQDRANAGVLVHPDGLDWNTYTPTLTATTSNPNIGTTGQIFGEYRRVMGGEWVFVQVHVVFGGTGISAGSGTYQISLPYPCGTFTNVANSFLNGVVRLFDSSASSFACGYPFIGNGGNLIQFASPHRSAGGADNVTNSNPWTWAAGDEIQFSAFYPTTNVTA